MKRTKNIISLLLLASLLVGCGSTEPEAKNDDTTADSGDTTTEAAEKSRLDELGAKDFGGKEFIIYDANDYPERSMNIYSDEKAGDSVDEAVYARDSKMADLYNVKIKYEQAGSIGAADACQTILQGHLAGDKVCDLVYSTAAATDTLMNLAKQNVLANMNDIEYLSFDKPWWSNFVYKNLTLDGKTYFMSGDITPTMYMTPMIIFGNLNLIEQYTPDADIYKLVSDGQWTIDKLIEYNNFSEDVNGDNVMSTSDDFFGFCINTVQNELTSNAFVVAGDVDLCTNTGDNITINLDNDHAASVVEKLSRIMGTKVKEKDYGDWILKAFPADKIIFAQAGMTNAQDLRNMQSDFLILLLPKYDEAQTNYKSLMNAWETAFTAIPANADTDMSGFLAEALCYESYVSVRPQVYDKLLKQKLARDEQSTQMIDLIFDTLTLDFNALANFGGTTTILADAVYKGKPLVSGIAEKKDKAASDIEKFIDSWNQE